MGRTTPRQALTQLAEHLRSINSTLTAEGVEYWRDTYYPPQTTHRHNWANVQGKTNGVWIDRKCLKCGLADAYGPLTDGDKPVGQYIYPDGAKLQRSKNRIPSCTGVTNV